MVYTNQYQNRLGSNDLINSELHPKLELLDSAREKQKNGPIPTIPK